MKVSVEFTDKEIRKAILSGVKKIDLYEIANDDIIRADHLHVFLEAALASLFKGRAVKETRGES